MIRSLPRLPLAVLALAAGSLLATLPAHAQGTEEQQEACAPDAVKLCQATIPDIPKTTACMTAHYAQLSPRCRAAFDDATGGKAPASVAHGDEAAPPPVAVAPREDDEPGIAAAPAAGGGIMDGYAAQIRSYCRQGLIDPFTCRNTLAVLRGSD